MAEIITARNVTIMKLISDVGGDLADLARWPDSDATKTTVDNSIKMLKKALKDSGYPHGFTYMAMLQIAFMAYSDTMDREHMSTQSLKQAWVKAADIL